MADFADDRAPGVVWKFDLIDHELRVNLDQFDNNFKQVATINGNFTSNASYAVEHSPNPTRFLDLPGHDAVLSSSPPTPPTLARIRTHLWIQHARHDGGNKSRFLGGIVEALGTSLLASGLRRHCAGPAGNVQSDSGPRWRVGKHGLHFDDAHKRVNERQLT
ncbi:hypothetical protein C8R45DRAFT_936896 [Mycena sanguinolenta]|nr:hypothetical protein C8R45DRAFT_936896 [Mycena sanguinolenta]